MKLIKFFLLFVSTTAIAQSKICDNEINVKTGKIMTADEWKFAYDFLQAYRPIVPTSQSLMTAALIVVNESQVVFAPTPSADKRAHCYVGCKIASETDFETASYIGWFKEHKDLTDCNKSSRSDLNDLKATEAGAKHGENSDGADCFSWCSEYY